MAVLVEAISVVIRVESINEKFAGGWREFEHLVPNSTLCCDNALARLGFMMPEDVERFVKKLESKGLQFLNNGESIDIVVTDQNRGPTS